jgi:hypothetical protein
MIDCAVAASDWQRLGMDGRQLGSYPKTVTARTDSEFKFAEQRPRRQESG